MKYSVIITSYKHLEDYLKPCIASIKAYSNLLETEIIVVANGCEKETKEYLEKENVKHLWFDDPIGYTRACNEGMKIATGDYIVLLNDDTVILAPTWLAVLEKPFLDNPRTGMVGPMKFTFDCGGITRTAIAFWCVMFRRSLIGEIGYMDEVFNPGMGEDGDYSIKAELAGYDLVQVPLNIGKPFGEGASDSGFPIYHKGNGTFGDNVEYKERIIERNRQILVERYSLNVPKTVPKYSIVIPTCNRLETLKKCLEAVLRFTDMYDKEIIVVPNGCTDGTEEYLKTLFGKVKFLSIKEASGHVVPANAGVDYARGEFVVLLDDDSILLGQPADTWINLLRAPYDSTENVGISGVFSADYPYLGPAMHNGCVMFRKSVWEKMGRFDTIFGFGYLYDTDFSLRLRSAGYSIADVGRGGKFPIYHPESPVTSETKREKVSLMRKNREILYRRHGMKPKYSIVIPTYNHLDDCLKPCLESLIKFTDMSTVEVIVVANGCKDKTAEYVDSLGYPFKLLWFDEGLGYTKATNEGIRVAQAEHIVLLNNDTVLLEMGMPKNAWLDMMMAPFLKDEKMGITGPLALYDSYADAVVMIFFCVMISRKLFDVIGLLDESYSPGGGEDIDFCVKARQVGYKQAVVPSPDLRLGDMKEGGKINLGAFPIYHLGEGTFSNTEFPEYGKRIIKDNGMKNMIRYNKHIRLNLGSGGVEFPGYVSVDKNDTRAHILLDVFDLDKHFQENSVEELLASHLFEHINPYKSVPLLKQWNKILKPGGKLIMEVPNIEEQCKDFLTADKNGRYGILNVIYGAVNTTAEGDKSDITAPHLWGWYPEMMHDHLIWAGFTDIKILPEKIPHPHKNFRVEAMKPVVFRDQMDKIIYDSVAPGESVLDLGCGDKSRTLFLNRSNHITAVDAWAKHKPDLLLDVTKGPLPFVDNSYDVVLMIDFIEHLDKDAGKKVIEEAIRISKKRVILFTPNFWTENKENVDNPDSSGYKNEYDYHKSLWKDEDFPGWESIPLENPQFLLKVWRKNEVLADTAVLQKA